MSSAPSVVKESMRVDLNADIGESFGAWSTGSDEQLLSSITSGSVACGYHAGDPSVMRRTVRLALRAGVAIGAHPGFPDLVGFGRREMHIAPGDVANLVLYQVGALSAIARAEGASLRHVKPHGALYNMAARRRDIAEAIVSAVASFGEPLIVVGPPGSELLAAAARSGLTPAAEGFADRGYEPDGSLSPRDQPGAVLRDPAVAANRALAMVRDGRLEARDGSSLRLRVDTICIHGDTAGAADIAAAIRSRLTASGIEVRSLGSRQGQGTSPASTA
jgi:UPF0271 protein